MRPYGVTGLTAHFEEIPTGALRDHLEIIVRFHVKAYTRLLTDSFVYQKVFLPHVFGGGNLVLSILPLPKLRRRFWIVRDALDSIHTFAHENDLEICLQIFFKKFGAEFLAPVVRFVRIRAGVDLKNIGLIQLWSISGKVEGVPKGRNRLTPLSAEIVRPEVSDYNHKDQSDQGPTHENQIAPHSVPWLAFPSRDHQPYDLSAGHANAVRWKIRHARQGRLPAPDSGRADG